jgi:MSHA pilin protein MshD
MNAGVGATGCSAAASVENAGAEAVPPYGPETRLSLTTPYDNVNDYHGLSLGPGITDITGAAITGLDAYTATVSVANQALGAVPASDALLITVTVTGPGNTIAVLQGYRVRYAPNALP